MTFLDRVLIRKFLGLFLVNNCILLACFWLIIICLSGIIYWFIHLLLFFPIQGINRYCFIIFILILFFWITNKYFIKRDSWFCFMLSFIKKEPIVLNTLYSVKNSWKRRWFDLLKRDPFLNIWRNYRFNFNKTRKITINVLEHIIIVFSSTKKLIPAFFFIKSCSVPKILLETLHF